MVQGGVSVYDTVSVKSVVRDFYGIFIVQK